MNHRIIRIAQAFIFGGSGGILVFIEKLEPLPNTDTAKGCGCANSPEAELDHLVAVMPLRHSERSNVVAQGVVKILSTTLRLVLTRSTSCMTATTPLSDASAVGSTGTLTASRPYDGVRNVARVGSHH